MNNQSLQNSHNNTQYYWDKTTISRRTHLQLPISPYRKNYEKARYYQEYKNPTKQIKTKTEIMTKVKNYLRFEREAIKKEVMKENPGLSILNRR